MSSATTFNIRLPTNHYSIVLCVRKDELLSLLLVLTILFVSLLFILSGVFCHTSHFVESMEHGNPAAAEVGSF